MGAYEDYSPQLASAAKWLHPDGHITDWEGSQLLPPDEARAADYLTRSPVAAKWLMPDGTIVSEIPMSGGTGDGGGETNPDGGGSNTDGTGGAAIDVTDSIDEIFITGNLSAGSALMDSAEISGLNSFTDDVAIEVK